MADSALSHAARCRHVVMALRLVTAPRMLASLAPAPSLCRVGAFDSKLAVASLRLIDAQRPVDIQRPVDAQRPVDIQRPVASQCLVDSNSPAQNFMVLFSPLLVEVESDPA